MTKALLQNSHYEYAIDVIEDDLAEEIEFHARAVMAQIIQLKDYYDTLMTGKLPSGCPIPDGNGWGRLNVRHAHIETTQKILKKLHAQDVKEKGIYE